MRASLISCGLLISSPSCVITHTGIILSHLLWHCFQGTAFMKRAARYRCPEEQRKAFISQIGQFLAWLFLWIQLYQHTSSKTGSSRVQIVSIPVCWWSELGVFYQIWCVPLIHTMSILILILMQAPVLALGYAENEKRGVRFLNWDFLITCPWF